MKGVTRTPLWFVILFAPLLGMAPIVRAQTTTVRGQVFDLEGNPFPGVAVTITSKDTGQTFSTKTDKNGRYLQIGLRDGIYTIDFKAENMHFSTERMLKSDEENIADCNFKEIAAKQGYNAEEARKKQEAAEQQFKNLKLHFDQGVAAANEAKQQHEQLATAPAEQKDALKAKMAANYQRAIIEFQQAQQAAGPKDHNLPIIMANLGVAYEGAGRYEDAVASFQKAAELKPDPSYFLSMATDMAHAGKTADASATCEKLTTLDAASGATCWRNLGIVYSNAGNMKEAVAPLRKATQLNPKDADAWFLLGGALVGEIETKEEGEKMIYMIPPGTAEAYQKYLELAPTGPRAAEAKEMLTTLATYQQGADTTIISKRKKKH